MRARKMSENVWHSRLEIHLSQKTLTVDILLKDSSCEVGNGLKQDWKCWKMENDKFADIFVRVMPSVIASHKLLCWASP